MSLSHRPPRPMTPASIKDASASRVILIAVNVTFVLLLCSSCYLAGSLLGQQSFDSTQTHGVDRLVKPMATAPECKEAEEKLIESKVREKVAELEEAMEKERRASPKQTRVKSRHLPDTTKKFAYGLGRAKKDDLKDYFDFGNPLDQGKGTGEEDAIIIYGKHSLPNTDKSLTRSVEYNDGTGIPLMSPKVATENCDAMNVIFTENPGNTRQCTAIIGNFESFHIQRWMKVNTTASTSIRDELPLSLVSRGYASRGSKSGRANFYAPPFDGKWSPVMRHWKMLRTFFQNVDSVLADLTPILKKVARNNTVVVLTCNKGQSALLMNFACSARRRGFDLGNILVFPTDVETKEFAEGLGLTTYYDEQNMGPLPSGEARRYGDKNFKAMMYAKVLCVLYPLMLHYDVLFQDVDLVWLKDPLEYFHDKASETSHFDVLFQHDGSNSVRYAPYAANSGFYYVRANKRSQYLFTSLLYHSDLIITWDSHQQVIVQLLAEHSSLFGLNVKVFDRDTDMFPGEYLMMPRPVISYVVILSF
ncbi:hypothetical protein ACHAWF_017961 [Thalassiosira exigua]